MNLRQFDLNLLVALDILLKERSVTRAAERLHLSQPAMSGMLARLRHAFDDELLVRVGRKLEPTEFAAGIGGRVREVVADLEELLDSGTRFDPANENRSFRIGASDYTVLMLCGPLLRRLTETAPNICVHFVRLDLSVSERLTEAEIDFGILPVEFETGLPSKAMFEDDWVCAAWKGHPVRHDRLTLDEFLMHPHIAFNISDPGHVSIADEYLAGNGYERKVVASTESFTAAPFLLKETSMLTMVPRRLGEAMREAAEIRLLELPFEVPRLKETLTWSPRFTSSLGHTWMREQLVDVAGNI
jgi:LysR family nod box-dependent transcriptional activator